MDPPFEIEQSLGAAGRRYLLDCMPNLQGDGKFRPHLVIRMAEGGGMVTAIWPNVPPFDSAAEAADLAYQVGIKWLSRYAGDTSLAGG